MKRRTWVGRSAPRCEKDPGKHQREELGTDVDDMRGEDVDDGVPDEGGEVMFHGTRRSVAGGGGRGIYAECEGDFPISMKNRGIDDASDLKQAIQKQIEADADDAEVPLRGDNILRLRGGASNDETVWSQNDGVDSDATAQIARRTQHHRPK